MDRGLAQFANDTVFWVFLAKQRLPIRNFTQILTNYPAYCNKVCIQLNTVPPKPILLLLIRCERHKPVPTVSEQSHHPQWHQTFTHHNLYLSLDSTLNS